VSFDRLKETPLGCGTSLSVPPTVAISEHRGTWWVLSNKYNQPSWYLHWDDAKTGRVFTSTLSETTYSVTAVAPYPGAYSGDLIVVDKKTECQMYYKSK
jgi:hypothetical protein